MSGHHAGGSIHTLARLPRVHARRWSRVQWAIALVLTLGIAGVARVLGRLWTWALVMTVIGFVLGAAPLLGVIGYELAVVMTIPAALMGLDLGAAIAREEQRVPATGLAGARYAGRAMALSTLRAAAVPVVLVCIPALLSAVRGIWLPTCDWSFGLTAYLLLPITTAALAGAAGHVIAIVVGTRRVIGGLGPFVPGIAVAVFALLRFYGEPPVFTYNAILGYFPGNLYDENIVLGATLIYSRVEQLAWLVAFACVVTWFLDVPTHRASLEARPVQRPALALVLATLAIATGTYLRTHSGQLGYAVDGEDIQEALGGRIETPHFIIHYSNTPELTAMIGIIAEDHELRYAQVAQQLGVQASRKLRSYYFADREQKSRWMGARDVEMAKPWRHEIYLEHRGWPHGSLRHEIAHAVASEFGDPLFGVAAQRVFGLPIMASPGLIEGLAVAIDWPGGSYERMTPHELVRVLQVLGKQPSISALLTLEFFSTSSATSYTTAGSFMKFLLDTYGAKALREVYHSGGDFDAAYGKSLARLESEWRQMIATIELPPGTAEAQRERFRVASVFSRPCPHAIAARREQAARANSAGDRETALALRSAVCQDAPDDPQYRLELANLLGEGNAAERGVASELWRHLALDATRVTSSLRGQAYEKLIVFAAARRDMAEVQRLLDAAARLQLGDTERRTFDGMRFALAHQGPAGTALRGYFFTIGAGLPSDPSWAELAIAAEPELGFGYYLRGLQHYGRGELVDAAKRLSRALQLGVPGIPFVKNGARRLAVAAYRANDPTAVRVAISALVGAGMSTADRLLATDWEQRLDFDAATFPR